MCIRDPDLFSVSGHRIPLWIQHRYRQLALCTDAKGILTGGYQGVADSLSISKTGAFKLVKRLQRLKLIVIREAGKPTSAGGSVFQLRRFFFDPLVHQAPIRLRRQNKDKPFGNLNSAPRAALSRRGDIALMRHFKTNGHVNDYRLASRAWHAIVWKHNSKVPSLERFVEALEQSRIHRPRKIQTAQAFMAWVKWLFGYIWKHGAKWRKRFKLEFDDRLDAVRLAQLQRGVYQAEEFGAMCPVCGKVWAQDDPEHGCRDWVYRKRDDARVDEWERLKERERLEAGRGRTFAVEALGIRLG